MNTVANSEIANSELPIEFNYHLLRYSLDDYGKSISQLDSMQYKSCYDKALKSYNLESLVVNSPEALNIVISPQQLDESIQTLASRYSNETEFIADLNNNFLDQSTLRLALHRELLFDAVMQQVNADSPKVKEVDIELFYEMHRERFETPEKRTASHILITINPEFPENTRAHALLKISEIEDKLKNNNNRFEELAKRYSECPSAMEGGKLGDVARGQLYPELDSKLFNMVENELSSVVESEIGFHLLLCKKIHTKKRIPLAQATPKIKEILQTRYLKTSQKSWLEDLQKQTV